MRWDPEEFLDNSSMYRNVMAFPIMLKGALALLGDAHESIDGDMVKNVVCCGMGGSGIGFEYMKAWLSPSLRVPVEIVRDYRIPSYVNESTLAISASYSGNTEETISCFLKSREAGAQSVVLTSGGALEEVARSLNAVLIELPKGLPPRAALLYMIVPISQLIERLGLSDVKVENAISEAVPEVAKTLEKSAVDVAEDLNEAKLLSKALYSRVPVIYGHESTYAVALRFKQQLNENSKMYSHCNQLLESQHNEVEGFGGAFSKNFVVVLLRSKWEDRRVSERFELTADLIEGKVGEVIQLRANGSSPISESLSMTALLDLTTVYLALLNRVNPSEVPVIDRFKSMLNRASHFGKDHSENLD